MNLQNIALALGLAGTGLIGNITQAIAAPFPPPPVEYQLNNVKFADGAIAAGTFDFSPFTPQDYYSNINISISGGTDSTFPSAIFGVEAFSQYGPGGTPNFLPVYGNGTGNGFTQGLDLSFDTRLTGQPGDISSISSIASTQAVGFFDPPLNANERITATRNSLPGGYVSAVVPEPSAELGTLAFGALGVGYLLKRQTWKNV